MTEQVVRVLGAGGVIPVRVAYERRGLEVVMECTTVAPGRWVGGHVFEAFQRFWASLEGEGRKPLCVGGRRDLLVTGVCVGMSDGEFGYLGEELRAGKGPRPVSIFERAEAEQIGTIREQNENRRAMVCSVPGTGVDKA